MGIFSYKDLDEVKQLEVYEFVKEVNEVLSKTFEELKKFYLGEVFNYGEDLYVSFDEDKVVGTIGVITKEIPIKGEAFITELYINKDFLDYTSKEYGEHIINELLNKAVQICENHKAEVITLGFKPKLSYLEGYVSNIGFNKTHEAIIMKYAKENVDKEEKLNSIELEPLKEENIIEFMEAHNKGFSGTTNAANLSLEEVQDFLKDYKGNEELIGIVKSEGKTVGMYMLAVIDNIGWIDNIAILEEYRTKGLGKVLIAKCIECLKNREVETIKLLVMSSNAVAYSFYKNYGFEEEVVFSTWYQKR